MSVHGWPDWKDVPLRLYGEERAVPVPEIPLLRQEGCGHDYDRNDAAQVANHTEPVGGGMCCRRCEGKPSCYPCGNMYCACGAH